MNLKIPFFFLLSIAPIAGAIGQAVHAVIQDSTSVYVRQGEEIKISISATGEFKDAVAIPFGTTEQEGYFKAERKGLYHLELKQKGNKLFRGKFIVDGDAPMLEFLHNADKIWTDNDVLVAGQGFRFQIKATEKQSGVGRTEYALGEGGFSEAKEWVNLDKEGQYKIRFRSIDRLGNMSREYNQIVKIDLTAPETDYSFQGEYYEQILSSGSKIKLTAKDHVGLDKVYYRWDEGSKWLEYTAPIDLKRFKEGPAILYYYASDKAGNTEEEKNISIFIDNTPPLLIEEITGTTFMAGDKEYSSGRSQLKITAVDNKSGVKEIYYSVNDGPFVLYSRPVFLSSWKGSINIKSYAIDNVGNRSQSSGNRNSISIPVVDLEAPESKHAFSGPSIYFNDTLYIGPKTSISLSAHDQESGLDRIEYYIDGQVEPIVYNQAFSLEKHGYQKLSYEAFDMVENSVVNEFKVFVDTLSPDLNIFFSMPPLSTDQEDKPDLLVYPTHTAVFLTVFDKHSGFKELSYSINQRAMLPYTGPITFENDPGAKTLIIRATDQTGNSIEKVMEFVIEVQ
ncbi:MAG: hypothetical protein GX587_09875 [Bacteroidales bacterium]|nr:hypothetical protein [Bacteroidales bacterium]